MYCIGNFLIIHPTLVYTDLLSSSESDWHCTLATGKVRASMASNSTTVPALCIAATMLAIYRLRPVSMQSVDQPHLKDCNCKGEGYQNVQYMSCCIYLHIEVCSLVHAQSECIIFLLSACKTLTKFFFLVLFSC